LDVALVTGDTVAFAATIDEPLVEALQARGATTHTPRWDDPQVEWASFDAVVVRTAWDYPARRDAFVAWAARVGDLTALWNPADVLRWNTHKSYLIELEDRGAPVVPTAWLAAGDGVDLAALLASRAWDRAIVKPAVGNGGVGLLRTHDVDPAEGQAHLDSLLTRGDVMVQPYLASIELEGEVSVVAIEGQVTHAIHKAPVEGEFRIQRQFGGEYARLDLAGDGREPAALAHWVLEAAGHELLYARVDLVRDDGGVWQLAELELAEPDLYLGLAPEVGDTLARAILART
jgi:glutathione synthase/RimK-type ligase-like ATP-grasp enzyme